MIDCDEILYAFLVESGTDLYALVGERVEYGQTPDGFANTQPMVVFLCDDGEPYANHAAEERLYLFHCYGGADNWASAKAVYQALQARLHGVIEETVGTLGVIMGMHGDTTGTPLVHPGTKHKLIQGRFRGKLKEID